MSIAKTIKAGLLAASFALAGALSADATVIWDQSPDTTGGSSTSNTWTNNSDGQNFAEIVNFGQGGTLTGIDIFSYDGYGSVGGAVTIRIWADDGGLPGALITSIDSEIATIDTEATSLVSVSRKYAEFDFAFDAGSFWIGMSGTGYTLGQTGLDNIIDDRMAQFSGETYSHLASVTGDMAFRLHGELGDVEVPEPAPLALLGLGLIGLGIARKRNA
ncbi:PEP-CTERM sorting domain-containing protein [Emcibacter nanhaiensis]|uniref:PEP-CTERM sorting domain-containing protein n=1 Tax=Emcibacter nanhaiensis TaxID=1505037 RepID=A0A501PTV0_9PROT|nr:PEP-CTERM sorting domain-containing protein [Emcibacter nanhaiensis]TPD63151.1 PEP-CTERM sorting domain-containing protein [Emcibacter nanhaiensis]